MAFEIFIRLEAENDIEQITLWYQSQLEKLDERFLDALEFKLDKLTDIAESFAIVYKNTRKILLDKFPYAIHYFIENNTVVVFAVLHTSKNPMHWQERADNFSE